jgi:hypothetical protein
MKDIDFIDSIFIHLYQKGGCDNIEIVIKDNFDIEIDSDERFKLFKTIISTGLIKEYNYSSGSHRHISLIEDGYQMMLQHGSYIAFLESVKQEKEKHSEEKNPERKNLELDIEKKEIERKYKPWEITVAIIGGACTIIVIIEQIIKLINWLIS